MKVQLKDIGPSAHYDVCVIGSGPAGLTVARKCAAAGKRVLVVEGGGDGLTDRSQAIYKGTTTGDSLYDLDVARLRFFGGSSNHWGGMSRTLDAEDFDAKGPFKLTAWPIAKSDLDPYLKEAMGILGVAPYKPDFTIEKYGLKNIGFSFSDPPVNFLEKYYKATVAHARIALALETNAVSFECDEARVKAANLQGYDGTRRTVTSQYFVLAAGGIENSRLLLWGDVVSGGRLTKNNKNVGRYWMEHPHFIVGTAFMRKQFGLPNEEKSHDRVLYFSPTKAAMERHGILNFGLRAYREPNHEGVKRMIADLLCVAPSLGKRVADLYGRELICGGTLRVAWEQEPRAENRITLTDAKDKLGMARINLAWKKGPADLKTARVATELFGKYLAGANIGRVRAAKWVQGKAPYPEDDERIGYHHLGGTRMAETPSTGVVDKNCRVFGQNNFFVAGSSVFPSGGHSNPTLPLVQLALRLGDHLAKLA